MWGRQDRSDCRRAGYNSESPWNGTEAASVRPCPRIPAVPDSDKPVLFPAAPGSDIPERLPAAPDSDIPGRLPAVPEFCLPAPGSLLLLRLILIYIHHESHFRQTFDLCFLRTYDYLLSLFKWFFPVSEDTISMVCDENVTEF